MTPQGQKNVELMSNALCLGFPMNGQGISQAAQAVRPGTPTGVQQHSMPGARNLGVYGYGLAIRRSNPKGS